MRGVYAELVGERLVIDKIEKSSRHPSSVGSADTVETEPDLRSGYTNGQRFGHSSVSTPQGEKGNVISAPPAA
jgi:hypothetical protein